MNNYCVYFHIRKSDNVIFYVGKGSLDRPKSSSGRSAYWHRIVNKHGFTIRIVKSGMNEECALSLERALIFAIGRENLCNHTDGGDGCRNPSAETRAKMSLAKIGKKRKKESIEKGRAKMIGRKMPKEAIEKTRIAHIGSKRSEEAKKKMSLAHVGRIVSEEARKNMSNARKGVKRSPEAVLKTAQSHIGMKRSDEAKKNISDGIKKSYERNAPSISCSNGMIFANANKASAWLRANENPKAANTGILKSARTGCTAYGYRWEYV